MTLERLEQIKNMSLEQFLTEQEVNDLADVSLKTKIALKGLIPKRTTKEIELGEWYGHFQRLDMHQTPNALDSIP